MRFATLIACTLLSVTSVSAQRDDAKTTRFDVVSIRDTKPPDELLTRHLPCALPAVERSGTRIRISMTQLCGLIRVAYDVGEYQVARIPVDQGIGTTNYFDVEALVERPTAPSIDDVRFMLRAVLAERFQLRVHREPQDMPVYVLVPTEGGPRLAACSNPDAPSVYVPGRIVSCKPPLPMARVAQFLSRETGRQVLDHTGLGAATFELQWLPDTVQPLADSPPSLFTAIREQLGLKLEPQRAPVDSIVIDHAERPSPN